MGYEIDFLPVGEEGQSGDALALRFGNLHGTRDEQRVAVIDGGFAETGEHLVEHIERYYSTNHVDLMVSTHPDGDHVAGLKTVLEEMEVGHLWMHRPWEHTPGMARLFRDGRVTDNGVRKALRRSLEQARELEQLALRKGIPITEPFASLSAFNGKLLVLGPSKEFYESLLPEFRGTSEPVREKAGALTELLRAGRKFADRVRESWDIETLTDKGETSAENETSTILLLNVDGQHLLFTGDAGQRALGEVSGFLSRLDFRFIQVPHHGSRRNVSPGLLDQIVGPRRSPGTKVTSAFVSAAKKGAPKHPAKKVANAFQRRGAPVHATQGGALCHCRNAPSRSGWGVSEPLPFFEEVEEEAAL